MKKAPRRLSLLLCLALLCTPVYAETTSADAAADSSAAVTMEEDVALREPNIKYFNKSDGTCEAAVYADAVHYAKGDAWEEIDNSLTDAVLLGDGATGQVQRLDSLSAAQRLSLSREARTEGKLRYADYLENTANDFIVQLPRKLATENPVMIRRGAHTLRVVPVGLADSTVRVTQPADTALQATALADSVAHAQEQQLLTIDRFQSKAEYSAVSDQVDLQYSLVGQQLKVYLVLQELPQQRDFSFDLTTDLRPVLQEDNSVYFLDAEEAVVFVLEAPRMYDAGDGYSRDIAVAVESTAQGCRYTLTPDREWLASPEREYPISAYPSVVTSPDPHYIHDTGVQQSNPDTNYYMMDRIYVGSGPNSTQGRMYYQLKHWPSVNTLTADTIVRAMFFVYYYPRASFQTGNNITLKLYRADSAWESSTITWNNQKNITGTYVNQTRIEDHRQVSDKSKYDCFYATKWVKRHYQDPSTDYGVRIQPETVTDTINRVCYISSDYTADYYAHPTMRIFYDPSLA